MSVGSEIHFGAISCIADDSAWLREAPLDVEALPVRGATHFRASSYGVLLRQPSASCRVTAHHPTACRRKRSGCSRLQRWIKHAVAPQVAAEQVAAIEFDEPALDLSDGLLGDSSEESECESIESTAEILMADNSEHRVPLGYRKPKDDRAGTSHVNTYSGFPGHKRYVPQALTQEQRDELHRRNNQLLNTPITGTTPRRWPWSRLAWPP